MIRRDLIRKGRIREKQDLKYDEFNGATANCDGFGRNAKDNDRLYLLAWLLF